MAIADYNDHHTSCDRFIKNYGWLYLIYRFILDFTDNVVHLLIQYFRLYHYIGKGLTNFKGHAKQDQKK
jgi:hypothetical protein